VVGSGAALARPWRWEARERRAPRDLRQPPLLDAVGPDPIRRRPGCSSRIPRTTWPSHRTTILPSRSPSSRSRRCSPTTTWGTAMRTAPGRTPASRHIRQASPALPTRFPPGRPRRGACVGARCRPRSGSARSPGRRRTGHQPCRVSRRPGWSPRPHPSGGSRNLHVISFSRPADRLLPRPLGVITCGLRLGRRRATCCACRRRAPVGTIPTQGEGVCRPLARALAPAGLRRGDECDHGGSADLLWRVTTSCNERSAH